MKSLAVAVFCVVVSVVTCRFNPAAPTANFSAADIENGINGWKFDEPKTDDQYTIYAQCEMEPNTNGIDTFSDRVYGTVDLKQIVGDSGTTAKLNLTGFATNDANIYHGFHVHEWGDLSGGCEAAGNHFNPLFQAHGSPDNNAMERHFGDLGNIMEDGSGSVVTTLTDSVLALEGPFSAVGRTIAVTQKYDDLGHTGLDTSSVDGNSGKIIACCVVGRTDDSHW